MAESLAKSASKSMTNQTPSKTAETQKIITKDKASSTSKEVPVSVQKPGSKDKLSAALLALFFGTFGLHKFYLGRTGTGIAYVAISVLSFFLFSPIIAILSLIDAIRLLLMSNADFAEKYNPEGEINLSVPNKHVTALLALTLGIMGIHKFYTGQAKQGLAYLSFGTLIPILVCAPALILSLVLLFAGGEDTTNALYISGIVLYLVSYLSLVFLVFTTQLVAMIEGAVILFRSQEGFERSITRK